MGPILNLGELVATQPRQKSALEQKRPADDAAKKYTNISEDPSLNREPTVASVSRVGLTGDSSRPSSSMPRPDSSVSSVADLKRDFDI